MNCAFEDVVELDRCLAETGDDWAVALPATPSGASPTPTPSPSWRWTTSWRCATRSPRRSSGCGKRVEHAIERRVPDHFESLYELVSFTTVPYAEARQRAAAQRRFPANVAALGAAGRGAGVQHGPPRWCRDDRAASPPRRRLRRRGRRPPRPAPPPQLRRVPRPRRRPHRAAAPHRRPRRDAVHHPAPGHRAVAEAGAPRAAHGGRAGRRRRPRTGVQEPGPRRARHAGPDLVVGRPDHA